MVIGYTLFPDREIHKIPPCSPNGRDRYQIDHLLINGKWRRSLRDVKVRKRKKISKMGCTGTGGPLSLLTAKAVRHVWATGSVRQRNGCHLKPERNRKQTEIEKERLGFKIPTA